VPSTSKNKHHSSEGGGNVGINIAYSIAAWSCSSHLIEM
jgi:hypothetical protein